MHKLWYVFGILVILYFLKVPSLVRFVDGNLTVLANVWNFTLDVMMNVKVRHPWLWMSLPFFLLILMRPQVRK